MTTPNFRTIHPEMMDGAWKAWNEGNAAHIMWLVGHQERGELLMDNLKPFLDRGIYEAALFECYTHGPHLHPAQWRTLFSIADRSKLLAQGDSLPTGPVTVYRGVAHCKHRRWIRGLSWTTNPNTAAWFASRFSSPDKIPAVYSIVAKPEDILLVTNGRAEEEVILAAWQCGRMKRLCQMPHGVKPSHATALPS